MSKFELIFVVGLKRGCLEFRHFAAFIRESPARIGKRLENRIVPALELRRIEITGFGGQQTEISCIGGAHCD